jgi:hypothetical protein
MEEISCYQSLSQKTLVDKLSGPCVSEQSIGIDTECNQQYSFIEIKRKYRQEEIP